MYGNHDETAIEGPTDFIIGRINPRYHLSFGFGIHRCMGNRLAEMQLRILWEEILRRLSPVVVINYYYYKHLPPLCVASGRECEPDSDTER